MSCGLAGFTPGARPVVALSEGAGVTVPGVVVVRGLLGPGFAGPLGDAPGVAAEPPAVVVPPALPELPPELWASASPPETTKIATVAQRRCMLALLLLES
jgi:hypothetical protein